jgi:hypothetical protein
MQRDAQRRSVGGNSGWGDDAGFLLLRSTRERKAMPSQKRCYACRSPPHLLGWVAVELRSQAKTQSLGLEALRCGLPRRQVSGDPWPDDACYSWSVATVVTHLRLRGSSCNLRLLLTLIGGLKVKAGTGGGDLADKNSGEIPICHSPNVGRDRSPRLQLRAGAVLCCGSHWPLGGNADGFKGRIDSGLIAGHDRHAEALHQQSAAGISFDQLGHRKSITGILPNSI